MSYCHSDIPFTWCNPEQDNICQSLTRIHTISPSPHLVDKLPVVLSYYSRHVTAYSTDYQFYSLHAASHKSHPGNYSLPIQSGNILALSITLLFTAHLDLCNPRPPACIQAVYILYGTRVYTASMGVCYIAHIITCAWFYPLFPRLSIPTHPP